MFKEAGIKSEGFDVEYNKFASEKSGKRSGNAAYDPG